jgi:hypothetical protein
MFTLFTTLSTRTITKAMVLQNNMCQLRSGSPARVSKPDTLMRRARASRPRSAPCALGSHAGG